jgi:hypothetical protein
MEHGSKEDVLVVSASRLVAQHECLAGQAGCRVSGLFNHIGECVEEFDCMVGNRCQENGHVMPHKPLL